MTPWFLLFGTLVVLGALGAMALRNPVHCGLSLVVTFVGLAGTYLDLGADFLGLAQILVYVGAVAILLVFVMLLTRTGRGESPEVRPGGWWWGGLVAALVAVGLVGALASLSGWKPRSEPMAFPTVRDLGMALMTDFVLPLQLVGVVLTAAMIGAAILALPERRGGRLGRTPKGEEPEQ